MCMQTYDVWRMVGKDVSVTAGAGEVETSDFSLNANDGDVVGISAAENYARVDLAKCLLTIEVAGVAIMKGVPITQLLPDGERHMWPVRIEKGSKLLVKLESRSANTVVATPITLIFHHETPANCRR